MTTILIADCLKPSVVMTSEIFKDRIPGVIVRIAESGKETLEKLVEVDPDMLVVDFDLPDVDGPSLYEALRKVYEGPILMTAFPDSVVKEAVEANLFFCEDASSWLRKPLKQDDLIAAIDQFLVNNHRTERRFVARGVSAQLIAKAAGRGKRAPKVNGEIVNISMGGVCVAIEGAFKVKKNQELSLAVQFPTKILPPEKKDPKKAKTKSKSKTVARKKVSTPTYEVKFKATVAWTEGPARLGLTFQKLSDVQKKGLMTYLRMSYEHRLSG